jgi:hypothetical protein
MSTGIHLGHAVVAIVAMLSTIRGGPPLRDSALHVHVDGADGRPAAGVHVTVAAWHEGWSLANDLAQHPGAGIPEDPSRVSGVTDRHGDVAVVPVSAEESCAVFALRDGQRSIVYAHWPDANSVSLRLHAPPTLHLSVRDPAERPVAGALIGLGSSNGSAHSCGGRTDAAGAATIVDVDLEFGAISSDESLYVMVDVPRSVGTAASIPLPFRESIDLRLEVPPTGTLRVEVADSRRDRIEAAGTILLHPVFTGGSNERDRPQLFTRDGTHALGPDGTLTLDRIALGGVYAVIADLEGLGHLEATGAGPTRRDEVATLALVVDDAAAAFTGTLVDEHDEPVRNAEFDASIVDVRTGERSASSPLPSLRTDGAGNFVVRPDFHPDSVPTERRLLELRKSGGDWIPIGSRSGIYARRCERFARVEIPVESPVARRSLGRIELLDARPLVHGRVVDRDGRPLARADVTIHRIGEGDDSVTEPVPWPDLVACSDSDGKFAIAGRLPGGEFVVIAHASGGGWSSPRTVPSDDAEVELAVEPAGSLRLVVEPLEALGLQVRMRRRDGSCVGPCGEPLDSSPAQDDTGDEIYFADHLRSGSVDVVLGLGRSRGGFLPIRSLEEVEIPPGGPASDRRLEKVDVLPALRRARLELTTPPDLRCVGIGQLDEHGRAASLVTLGLETTGRAFLESEMAVVQFRHFCGNGGVRPPPAPRFGTARFDRSVSDRGLLTWNIEFPVAGDRWDLVVDAPGRALLQIRAATGPVALAVPDLRRVPIRMDPRLSRDELERVRVDVRLVPKDVRDPEFRARAGARLDGDGATVPLLAAGPNSLIVTLRAADSDAAVERSLVVDLPERDEQPPIAIPFARELLHELDAAPRRRGSR